MRRLFWEDRERTARRSRRVARLESSRADRGKLYGQRVRELNAARTPKERVGFPQPRQTVVLQGDLRLTNNANHALEQLAQLENPRLPDGRRVEFFVDLQAVTSLDAPALLFLTSRIDALRKNPFVRPNGNFPKHAGARQTLSDANFPRWLSKKAHRPPDQTSGRLELYAATRRRDLSVRPQIAASIKKFLTTKGGGNLQVEEEDMLGWAVQEALENVWTHAYGTQPEHGGWQAVGFYTGGVRSVAVVDMGVGIVKTATKGARVLPFSNNLDRLEMASKGLLTASGHPKNGQGLSSLVAFCSSGSGRRLHVLSSEGRLVWSNAAAPVKAAIPKLRGTIVCLEIDDA